MAANSFNCHQVYDSVHGTMKSFIRRQEKAERAKNRTVLLGYQGLGIKHPSPSPPQSGYVIKPKSCLCWEVCGSVVGVAKTAARILCFPSM